MGCDIHFYTEGYCKYNKGWQSLDKWTHCLDRGFLDVDRDDAFYHTRDYGIFAQLAGVRSYALQHEVISEPRGLPFDASEPVRNAFKAWGSDAHTASFLYLDELKQVVPDFYPRVWEEFLGKVEALPKRFTEPKCFRAVFWFDN